MKENVIIGKPIPAGTGMKRYRNIKLDSDERMNELLMEDEFFDEEEFVTDDAEEMNDAAFVDSFDDEDDAPETDEKDFFEEDIFEEDGNEEE